MADKKSTPDQPDEQAAAEAKAKEIAAEARESFDLDAFLAGNTHLREKVVTLYVNLQAVDAYNEAKAELATIADDDEHKKDREDQDRVVEEAKVKMLAGAMVIRLKGYPKIATKVARREVRKNFVREDTKMIPEELLEEAQEALDHRLIGESIQSIKTVNGELPFKKKSIGARLARDLPNSQWVLLESAWREITLEDGVAQAAIADPGF